MKDRGTTCKGRSSIKILAPSLYFLESLLEEILDTTKDHMEDLKSLEKELQQLLRTERPHSNDKKVVKQGLGDLRMRMRIHLRRVNTL